MYAYIIAAVVGLVMLASGAYEVYQAGANSVRVEQQARDLKAAQDYAAKEREITEAYRAKEAKWSQSLAAVSKDYQRKVAANETQRLADIAAIDARTIRLRDPSADNQACGSEASDAATDPAGHHGSEGTYLSSKAATFLLGLVTEADAVATQLSACQAVLTSERQ